MLIANIAGLMVLIIWLVLAAVVIYVVYKHPAENPLLSSGGMNAFNKLKFYCKWQV